MRPTFLDRSWPDLGRKIAPMLNEFTDFEKSSFLWSTFPTFWLACWTSIFPAAVLLSELERLYESCNILRSWGRSPFQGWAPGRAAEIRLKLCRRHFSENFGHFLAPWPNLSVKRDFSKAHKWTWDLHSWIGRDLIKREKLVRSQTNSQILRNLHFCDQLLALFD